MQVTCRFLKRPSHHVLRVLRGPMVPHQFGSTPETHGNGDSEVRWTSCLKRLSGWFSLKKTIIYYICILYIYIYIYIYYTILGNPVYKQSKTRKESVHAAESPRSKVGSSWWVAECRSTVVLVNQTFWGLVVVESKTLVWERETIYAIYIIKYVYS